MVVVVVPAGVDTRTGNFRYSESDEDSRGKGAVSQMILTETS